MLRRVNRWLQPLILILAVAAIAWFLATQWSSLRSYPWRLNGAWLATAILLLFVTWAVEVWIWKVGLRQLGGVLRYSAAWRIWFLSAVVRYVPGNVLQPLSMTLYARHHGVEPEATLISILLYQVIVILAALPIALVHFVWIDTRSASAHFIQQVPDIFLWLALLPVLVFLLRPRWLVALLNVALVRMGRPPLPAHATSLALLILIVAGLVDWLLWGATFAAFTFAVAGISPQEQAELAPRLIAAFPIANVIAFLSIVVPSGLGVREGALYLLLSPYMAGGVVTVIAIAMRVFTTVGELLLALIAFPFERPYMPAAPGATQPTVPGIDPAGDAIVVVPAGLSPRLTEPPAESDYHRDLT